MVRQKTSRKLIKFSQSYCIVLPKDWVKNNKLKKGNNLLIEIENRKLVIKKVKK